MALEVRRAELLGRAVAVGRVVDAERLVLRGAARPVGGLLRQLVGLLELLHLLLGLLALVFLLLSELLGARLVAVRLRVRLRLRGVLLLFRAHWGDLPCTGIARAPTPTRRSPTRAAL